MMGKAKSLLFFAVAAWLLAAVSGCGRNDVAAYVKQGTAAADSGDWEKALELAGKGVKRAPQNVDALLLKAIAARHCGQTNVAYEAAALAAALAPDNFSVQYTLGCICLETPSRKAEAKRAFQSALKQRPNDRDTLIALCNLTAGSNEPGFVLYLKRLRKSHPEFANNSAVFHNQRGVAYMLAGKPLSARREFDLALAADPDLNDPAIVYNSAWVRDGDSHAEPSAGALYIRFLELTANDRSAKPIRKLVLARVKALGGR